MVVSQSEWECVLGGASSEQLSFVVTLKICLQLRKIRHVFVRLTELDYMWWATHKVKKKGEKSDKKHSFYNTKAITDCKIFKAAMKIFFYLFYVFQWTTFIKTKRVHFAYLSAHMRAHSQMDKNPSSDILWMSMLNITIHRIKRRTWINLASCHTSSRTCY